MAAADAQSLDLAIIGGGLAGVVALHYARQAGLDARVFERETGVGGLWRKLPAWQDIQITAADWQLAGLPLENVLQPGILASIEAWVERFALADGIALAAPVRHVLHDGAGWTFETPRGSVRARHLIAATGAHNTPNVPPVRRRASAVREFHSMALRDPTLREAQRVLVVGGGGSAFDLLDLALEHGAARIHWAHRGIRWFLPSRKPKSIAGSVRGFARMQWSGMTPAQQSAAITADMRSRFDKFGIAAIAPPFDFDVQQHQLMPGRHRMLSNFDALDRHAAGVESIDGGTVTLTDGTRLAVDMVLWGTGYAVDLSYFDDPRIAELRTLEALQARCGGIIRSLDAPDLYFMGVGLDGIGSGTWAYSLLARSIASHIRGTAQLDLEPVAHKVNHFDLVRYLAARDPASYPPGWEDAYRSLALDTPDDQPYPIP